LRQHLSLTALDLSRHRKAQAIQLRGGAMRFLDVACPSTDAECESDWNHAVTQWTERLMWDRGFPLDRLAGKCYGYVEATWLDEIKRYLAYFRWLDGEGRGTSEEYYFQACEELRKRLASASTSRDLTPT
jgi:hypothetical protein